MPEETSVVQESPKQVEISEDALKLMVAQYGVRGTARMLGMDQTQTDTFRQRVTRAKWLQEPAMAAMYQANGLGKLEFKREPIVAKMSPTAVLAREFQELGSKTKLAMARSVEKVAGAMESMDGETLFQESQNVKASIQSASLIHGWDKSGTGQTKIRLELIAGPGEKPAYDIESQVVPNQDWDESDPI